MCTPTDRALAIEELEHLESRVRSWMFCLRHAIKCPTCQRALPIILSKEMEKELSK